MLSHFVLILVPTSSSLRSEGTIEENIDIHDNNDRDVACLGVQEHRLNVPIKEHEIEPVTSSSNTGVSQPEPGLSSFFLRKALTTRSSPTWRGGADSITSPGSSSSSESLASRAAIADDNVILDRCISSESAIAADISSPIPLQSHPSY
ncbi:hypothetical protein M5K25_025818 [Dendrobium thyrsiflorum]|uniref:Uncharacterized protein n=1 Tax=Dendrobium thyrsiflorum TaxID=117978 RepID=A0ABD0U4T3_DENTH